MNPGRILGIVLGIIILVAVFALPFYVNPPLYTVPAGTSLFGIVSPWLADIGGLQQMGSQAEIALAYVLIVSFILLAIAGVVGFFPLGCGVLGIVGMALATVGPLVIVPGGSLDFADYGMGYFVAWIASIAALAASFWRSKEKKAVAAPAVNVSVTTPPAPPPPPAPEIVVSPTITVTQTQVAGEGRPLRPEEQAQAVPVQQVKPGETTPQEVAKAVDILKQKQSSGEITPEKLREELGKMMYADSVGKYWTIDFRTGKWVYHDGTKWVEASPPATLKPA